MPNVMAALPNIGEALCSTLQSLADAQYLSPQTGQQISADSGPKFSILRGHEEEVLLFNKFFSDCRYMP